MNSFSILKTNVGLTTNVKIMVDSKYKMYLESFDSTPELSSNRFKKFEFISNNLWDELLPQFYKNLPIDIAYFIKNNSVSDMNNDFSNQYDDTYIMGARNIIDNKNYKEEFEFFAPIYFYKGQLPKYFVIFRIDGPGVIDLNQNTFSSEFLDKLKIVNVFDLTKKTGIGQWLDLNFTKNKNIPSSPLYIDFRSLEFSKWYGIDYESGGWTSKSQFLDPIFETENSLFDLEKNIFDGWKNKKIIFPNILNLSFLFDDSPATPTSLRKWSINRYAGFYFSNFELIDKITPISLTKLKDGTTIIDGNFLQNLDYDTPFESNILLNNKEDYWIEYNGDFFKIDKVTEKSNISININTISNNIFEEYPSTIDIVKWKIISDVDLSGKENFINKKKCFIDSNGIIYDINGDYYTIDNYDNSDMWIIQIDDKYFKLIKIDNYIKIVSDYGFRNDNYTFEYYINDPDPNYSKKLSLDYFTNGDIIFFNIFRCEFSDIKDFDTDIVSNKFSNFEYELESDITQTDEEKLYSINLNSQSYPKSNNDYYFNSKVEHIPVSSDYTANLETFQLIGNELTPLWNINKVHCRFSYQLSYKDYLLNNSLLYGEWNKMPDVFNNNPNRIDKNLDYFLTINSGTTSYKNHSLHVNDDYDGYQNFNYKFDIKKYFNMDGYEYDYFSNFFGNKSYFNNSKISISDNKWSNFNPGDESIPNNTLFNGIKFQIYDLDSIYLKDSKIESLNLLSSNKFKDYKFSILLSKNDHEVNNDNSITNTFQNGNYYNIYSQSSNIFFNTSNTEVPNLSIGDVVDIGYYSNNYNISTTSSVTYVGLTGINSYGFSIDRIWSSDIESNQQGEWKLNLQWDVIKHWKYETDYKKDDIVIYEDILFICVNDNNISDPLNYPSIDSNWQYYSGFNIFWNPSIDSIYPFNTYLYRFDEYWQNINITSSAVTFWDPSKVYNVNDIVLDQCEYWKSLLNSNKGLKPNKDGINWMKIKNDGSFIEKWKIINIWDKNKTYSLSDYVVDNKILYQLNGVSSNNEYPSFSSNWIKKYNIEEDTNFVYNYQINPIVIINNNYYLIKWNKGFTLNNGITIYINKKWKNILINIYINDNTLDNISNSERDNLYNDMCSKLTASNFIKNINDINITSDFSDSISYVIIETDGSFKKYTLDNISKLPHILQVEFPDAVNVQNNSLLFSGVDVNKNIFNTKYVLKNGNIDNISMINYLNDEIPLAVSIEKNNSSPVLSKNYNGQTNIIYNTIYRYSGEYMPLFKNINLFYKNSIEFGTNYKFDTTLTDFGKTKVIVRKVNRNGSILKLKDNKSYKSIYPMIDEFGLYEADVFIFKSTWDKFFNIETEINK